MTTVQLDRNFCLTFPNNVFPTHLSSWRNMTTWKWIFLKLHTFIMVMIFPTFHTTMMIAVGIFETAFEWAFGTFLDVTTFKQNRFFIRRNLTIWLVTILKRFFTIWTYSTLTSFMAELLTNVTTFKNLNNFNWYYYHSPYTQISSFYLKARFLAWLGGFLTRHTLLMSTFQCHLNLQFASPNDSFITFFPFRRRMTTWWEVVVNVFLALVMVVGLICLLRADMTTWWKYEWTFGFVLLN